MKSPVKTGNFSALHAVNDSAGWVVHAGQLMGGDHWGACSTMPGQAVAWRGLGYEPVSETVAENRALSASGEPGRPLDAEKCEFMPAP